MARKPGAASRPSNRLKAWREHKGLSQPELAELVGTHAQQISRWERGERDIRQKWIGPLITALGITESELLRVPPPSVQSEREDILGALMAEEVQHVAVQLLRELIRQQERQTSAIERLTEALERQSQQTPPSGRAVAVRR